MIITNYYVGAWSIFRYGVIDNIGYMEFIVTCIAWNKI